jgi:hypothetical protein
MPLPEPTSNAPVTPLVASLITIAAEFDREFATTVPTAEYPEDEMELRRRYA